MKAPPAAQVPKPTDGRFTVLPPATFIGKCEGKDMIVWIVGYLQTEIGRLLFISGNLNFVPNYTISL